ncbi:hypothetical protein PIB30_038284 [Stylosanthes scabra]|uniref:RRM domain-containing protein n=1 Tax=Stylosanthes scabra TaxID=79078 RepID=A0ABU6QFG5_9FABA|nr:hypothetical protein [Stylosanthes scabra]
MPLMSNVFSLNRKTMTLRAAQPSFGGLWRLISSRSAFPPSATAAAFARQAFVLFSSLTRVMIDRTGCSKEYGFVQYATTEEAAKGIENTNGKFLDGWVIFVEYAKSISEPTQQCRRHLLQ